MAKFRLAGSISNYIRETEKKINSVLAESNVTVKKANIRPKIHNLLPVASKSVESSLQSNVDLVCSCDKKKVQISEINQVGTLINDIVKA